MGNPDLRFGVPPHKLYLRPKKIEMDSAERSEASVADKRAAERSKVKAKTWCRAIEGEAVRHSHWSIIQAVCAALSSLPLEESTHSSICIAEESTDCLGRRR